MLSLNEAINQLNVMNSMHWLWFVVRRQDGHMLRNALEFEDKGKRKKR